MTPTTARASRAPRLAWAVQWQVHVHEFTKWQQPFVERPPADSFEGRHAIGPNNSNVDHPGCILGQPGNDRMNKRDLTLDALFDVDLVGAEDVGDLFHNGFDLAVGCRDICVRVLLDKLVELFDLQPRFCQRMSQQLQDGRLIV